MKLFYVFLILCVWSVHAQRRTSAKLDSSEVEPTQRLQGRGRTRFTSTRDFVQANEPKVAAETQQRRTIRKKVDTAATFERRASKPVDTISNRNYEVEEIVDESPIDPFRRQSKSRVLTETHFEAKNAPRKPLFRPDPTTEALPVEDLIKSTAGAASLSKPIESPPSTAKLDAPSDLEVSPEATTPLSSNEGPKVTNDIKKQTEARVVESPALEGRRSTNRRTVVRTRGPVSSAEKADSTTQNSRVRSRTRATRKPVENAASSTSAPHSSRQASRTSRRRSDVQIEATKGPSVFGAEETHPTRSRTGRRIGGEEKSPEKLTIDLNTSTRSRGTLRRNQVQSTTERANVDRSSRRRVSTRFQSRSEPATTKSSVRGRSRTRTPPAIPEEKLEVLPLFESETKTVKPIGDPKESLQKTSAEETVELSATENDVKYAKPDKPSPSKSSKVSVSVETRTESSVRRKPYPRKSKPVVQESVVSEVTEVTSKRTIGRRRNGAENVVVKSNTRVKVDKPKVTVSQVITSSRGRKKAEVNVNKTGKNKSELSSSEEEIDDSDNYPAPFKALIQAKKSKKESRSSKHSGASTITSTVEKIVTSSEAPSTSAVPPVIITSEAPKEEEIDNELEPKPSSSTAAPLSRPTRKRFSLSTRAPSFSEKPHSRRQTLPTKRTKSIRSTTAFPQSSTSPTKEHRFHAKFVSKSDRSQTKSGRSFSPKPPRGLYSSRNKEGSSTRSPSTRASKNLIETPIVTTQIPKSGSFKKSNRYSSRYRSDISSRGRSTTSAPAYIPTIPTAAYIPTIPTVTPPTSVKLGVETKDNDLGLEVITFDDPVNTVPSANLVSGEYLSSSTDAQKNPVTVVSKAATTEKPVSIIERIINSITAISTTASPEPKSSTVTTVTNEPTKGSAILKLATKKPTKLDKTQDDNQTEQKNVATITSEKPTTVIERILSSLSAIQATDVSNSIQVGNDFNTISSPSTTPISRVTKSPTSLYAQSSTSINPLSVLDEISEEQVLQKRTIGKLLSLLNGLTSTTASSQPDKLVVVTPKPNSFTVGGAYPPPVTTTKDTVTTTPELFTSPNPASTSVASTIPQFDTRFAPVTDANSSATSLPVTTPDSVITTQSANTVTTEDAITTETVTMSTTETLTSTQATSPTSNTNATTDTPTTTISNEISQTPNSVTQRTTQDGTKDLGVLPLFLDPSVTSSLVDSTSANLISDSLVTTTESGSTDTDVYFTIPSTLPTFTNFEVDVDQNTVSSVEANPLSASSTNAPSSTTPVPNTSTQSSTTVNPSSASTTTASTTTASSVPATASTTPSTTAATTTNPNISKLTELLNGRTVEAFNNIINNSNSNSNNAETTTTPPTSSANYQTLEVNKWNQVLNIQDLLSMRQQNDVVYRWKPVIRPYSDEVDQKETTAPVQSSTSTTSTTPAAPTTTTPRLTTTPIETSTANQATTTTTTSSPTTLNLSNRILENTIIPSTPTPSAPTTIPPPTTSPKLPSSTTNYPVTTFSTLFSTILSTLQPGRITTPPTTTPPATTEVPTVIVTAQTEPIPSASTPQPTIVPSRGTVGFFDTITTTDVPATTLNRRSRTTTRIPTTTTISNTIPVSTTLRSIRTTASPTVLFTSPVPSSVFTTPKLKQLTEEQKKNLETLAELEKEQAAILQQLSFLTSLGGANGNFNGNNDKATTQRSNLANRVIALAMERDRTRSTTAFPTSIQDQLPSGNREGKKLSVTSDSKGTPSLEEVLKQYNISGLNNVTPSSESTYGKSNDALLAAILKEQGIGPTTPKNLAGIFTTTRKPKPTTRAPGRLMQGLNWLLNVLAPPTTRRPKAKKVTAEPELLTNQPTHITPVVTAAPRGKQFSPNALSQDDIQKLIKQLETIQKDPKNQELDFSQINSIQNLLNTNEGVQVITPAQAGSTTRFTSTRSTTRTTTTVPLVRNRGRVVKSTTASPTSVSNSLEFEDEEEFSTTSRPKMTLPPLRLRPVPGIDENADPLIRGNLITAAVNVTRAISTFLGSALQDAAHQFSRMFSNGSANISEILTSSSLPNVASGSNPSG